MTLHRFFVPPSELSKRKVIISESDAKHIRLVLRLRKGDQIIVSDGKGTESLVRIIEVRPSKVVGEVIKKNFCQEPLPRVSLFQSLPKASKMDLVVQKVTELGVSRIVPIITERSIPKIGEGSYRRLERWRSIAREAAKQSQRAYLPVVEEILKWSEAMERLNYFNLVIVPWEKEQEVSFEEAFSGREISEIALVIGPEGGFSEKEVEDLLRLGARTVSLGKQILRTETAAIAAVVLTLYHTGRLGAEGVA